MPLPSEQTMESVDGQWREATLGDVAQVRSGYAFKSADWKSIGIPVVKIANVKGGSLAMAGCAYVSPTVASQAGRFNLQEGDILVALTGYIGDVAFIRSRDLPAVLNQRVGLFLILDESRLDNSFLFQLLRNPDMRESIEALGYGSAQPNVSPTLIHNVTIPLPPLPEQRAIAHILGTLDDKIELNWRMNETLEEMARALFKSWFVDFDPVRAKMEGRWRPGESLPGLPAHLYDLFPDRLVDSELGEIPEGWEVKPLGDLMDYREGPGIRNWQYTNSEEGTRFINIRCIQDGDIQVTAANRITDEEANAKYAHFHLKEWDVVVSTSGTLGRTAVVRKAHLPLVLNTSVIRFRSIEGVTSFSYVYGYLNSHAFLDELETSASGSVQKNFGPMHLKQIRMLCPPYDCIEAHDHIADVLFQKLTAKRTENDTIANHRDALLPMLLGSEGVGEVL